MSHPVHASPVGASERIITLDIIRGIAILGILLMNIQSFSNAGVASHIPTTLNETGTVNFYIWYFIDWIFDGTQRALFSMLFGAGIVLFVSRQENKTEGLWAADLFFRRQLWLILFSLIDVYILLWNGDILLDYALYGMLLFTFRNSSPKKMILLAGVCLLFMTLRENVVFYHQKNVIKKGEVVALLDTTSTKLSSAQKKDLEAMIAFKKRNEPSSRLEQLKTEQEQVLGSYTSAYEYRTNKYLENLVDYTYFTAWDVLACMLLGMAFFKVGILTGNASRKVYTMMCVFGLGIGLTLSHLLIQYSIQNNFNWYEYTKKVPFSFYEIGRMSRAIGILGLIMLVYKSNFLNAAFSLLRPVGQMAFTNYLMQSLICGILFNGYGLGLFGKLQRYEVYEVVAAIWIFQIVFSNLWLRYFLFGPFEWSWRSLTYWKRHNFLRAKREPAPLAN